MTGKTPEVAARECGAAVVLDTITDQLEDLFLIRNPRFKFDQNYAEDLERFIAPHRTNGTFHAYGEWFYYPWSTTLAHVLPETEWQEMRTARNRDLITEEEQRRFAAIPVGIAGLSVGSHVALTLVMMGGANTLVLADPDEVGPSNLNRIRATMLDIGVNKAEHAARAIWEVNPYANITVLTEGITETSIGAFFDEKKIGILIEETDKLDLKIRLREEARKRKIPVVMGTDNGDGIIIDVERYDFHADLQLFNGVVGNVSSEAFRNFPPQDLPKLATRIAGPEFAAPRMKDSILRVGKTLYSWPQLGDAAALCGVVIAYIVRRIANGMPTREGKYEVNLDAVIDPNYLTGEALAARKEHHRAFMAAVGLDA